MSKSNVENNFANNMICFGILPGNQASNGQFQHIEVSLWILELIFCTCKQLFQFVVFTTKNFRKIQWKKNTKNCITHHSLRDFKPSTLLVFLTVQDQFSASFSNDSESFRNEKHRFF